MPPHIVIVGSLNMDLVVRTPHMPAPGETILGDDFRIIPGGKGANQAVAAARLGAQVSMVGRVGADAFGRELLQNLRSEKVDATHVAVDDASPSGIAMITVDAAGQNSIVVASGANMRLTPAQVKAALTALEPYDVLVMQLESPVDCVLAAAKQARAAGARVILNPAPAQALSPDLLQAVHVLIPNESETAMLTGLPVATREQAEAAARALLALGPDAVILTLGGQGALVAPADAPSTHLSPHQVKVVDATAAGDAFVAGLAVGLGEGLTLAASAGLGNAAGALAVSRMGAQPAMPTRGEVRAMLDSA